MRGSGEILRGQPDDGAPLREGRRTTSTEMTGEQRGKRNPELLH